MTPILLPNAKRVFHATKPVFSECDDLGRMPHERGHGIGGRWIGLDRRHLQLSEKAIHFPFRSA